MVPNPSGKRCPYQPPQAGRTGTRAAEQRAKALQRDNHACQTKGPQCLVHAEKVDHGIPVHLGGTDDLANLNSACVVCHAEKTARDEPG